MKKYRKYICFRIGRINVDMNPWVLPCKVVFGKWHILHAETGEVILAVWKSRMTRA